MAIGIFNFSGFLLWLHWLKCGCIKWEFLGFDVSNWVAYMLSEFVMEPCCFVGFIDLLPFFLFSVLNQLSTIKETGCPMILVCGFIIINLNSDLFCEFLSFIMLAESYWYFMFDFLEISRFGHLKFWINVHLDKEIKWRICWIHSILLGFLGSKTLMKLQDFIRILIWQCMCERCLNMQTSWWIYETMLF